MNKYPVQSTPHEVAEAAIGTDDIDTISRLANSDTYLPIRWDAFVADAPLPMIREFYHLLTPEGKARVTSPGNTPLDILIDSTTRENYEDRLSMAIKVGNLDYVRNILYKYHPSDIRDYIHGYVPKAIILWLDRSSWISLTPMEEATIYDNPSLLEDTTDIPLDMVVYYDAITIYRLYGGLQVIPTIHGDILRYIIDKVQDTHTLDTVIMKAKDIAYGLQVYADGKMAIYYLSRAMGSGYYELLDRYMSDDDLLPTTVSKIVSSIGLDHLPNIVTYLNHRYGQPVGTWLECYISRDICNIVKVPPSFWIPLLENAIIYGDVHTVSNILRIHTLSLSQVDTMYKLAQQYQITRPIIYSTLVMMIRSQ